MKHMICVLSLLGLSAFGSSAMASSYWGISNATTVLEFCADFTFNSGGRLECRNFAQEKDYFQPRGLEFCMDFSFDSNKRMDCLRFVADKYFPNDEIRFCYDISFQSAQRLECLRTTEQIEIPAESSVTQLSKVGYGSRESAFDGIIYDAKSTCRNYSYFVVLNERWRNEDCYRYVSGDRYRFSCYVDIKCSNSRPE